MQFLIRQVLNIPLFTAMYLRRTSTARWHVRTMSHKVLLVWLATLASMTLWAASLSAQAASDEAQVAEIPPDQIVVTTREPARDVGYTVGDILERTITVEVKKPYKLEPTSLPIVGYERRYRGQVIGIILHSIRTEREEQADKTRYTLHLAYQVFTNNVVAKAAFLPAEILRFSKAASSPAEANKQVTPEVRQYRVPEWGFRISPLAVYGSVKLEDDMSPMLPPPALSDAAERQHIRIFSVVLVLALLLLAYIHANSRWLPVLNRPFARALRKIKTLPETEDGLREAISLLHQALNNTAGQAIFHPTITQFLLQKPGFSHVSAEISQFFTLSNQVFFDPTTQTERTTSSTAITESLQWLRDFCTHCRDCERGLRPAVKVAS